MEKRAVAVMSDDLSKLTFSYDDLDHSDAFWFAEIGDGSSHPWCAKIDTHHSVFGSPIFASNITLKEVEFDKSFKDYEGLRDLSEMFCGCESLKEIIGLENLNTSHVDNMINMFYGCKSLEKLDLRDLDVSKLEFAYSMFYGCTNLETLDLSGWDTSEVKDTEMMFAECHSLKEICGFENLNMENVTHIQRMFEYCSSLEKIDLSGLNTSNLEWVYYMFDGCENLKQIKNIEYLNISNVSDLSGMFKRCKSLEKIDLSYFDTFNIAYTENMFWFCENLQEIKGIENWQIHDIQDMSGMFAGCKSLQDIDFSGWKTRYLVDIDSCFMNCNLSNESMGSLDISHVMENLEDGDSFKENMESVEHYENVTYSLPPMLA